MLEKARIHRAMLIFDESQAFAASDIARETGAAITTIRKNLDRDLQVGWLLKEGVRTTGMGRPETLYRFTGLGRRQAGLEMQRAYSALATVDTRLEEEPSALVAGRELLESLKASDLDQQTFADRLQMAQAALEEAVLTSAMHGRKIAQRLCTRVIWAIDKLAESCQAEDAAWETVRERILGELDETVEHDKSTPSQSTKPLTSRPDLRLIYKNRDIPVPEKRVDLTRLMQPPTWRERPAVPILSSGILNHA